MTVLQFLIDTPVVAFMLLLALLVTVVPIGGALLSPNKSKHPDDVSRVVKEPPITRFVGIQLDIAILIFGLLLLAGVVGWMYKTFYS